MLQQVTDMKYQHALCDVLIRRIMDIRLCIHQRQGQVLVLGLSMIAVLMMVLLGMFHIGIVANTKVKQTHAVDAAAYSGALIQARALNMQSYINIAQVGHQMAMAHLVTLGSWADWASTQAKSLSKANPPAWVIAAHFGAKHGQAYSTAAQAFTLQGMAKRGGQLAQQFSQHDEIVTQVLAKASYAIQQDMFEARDQAIQTVLQHNYPDKVVIHDKYKQGSVYSAKEYALPKDSSSITNKTKKGVLVWWLESHNHTLFSRLFQPVGNYRSLLAEVTSVYRFLDKRQHIARGLFPVSSHCPTWRHELRRQGFTVLNKEGNWQSIDTESYHALHSNKWIGCYYREYPMGWGWVLGQTGSLPKEMAYATNPPNNFAKEDFWRWVERVAKWNIFGGNDNPLANSYVVRSRQRWSGGGLVPYVDIDHSQAKKRLDFILHLSQTEVKGHTLHLKAAAETFFERPVYRADGRHELANLWHPYWQARLIAVP